MTRVSLYYMVFGEVRMEPRIDFTPMYLSFIVIAIPILFGVWWMFFRLLLTIPGVVDMMRSFGWGAKKRSTFVVLMTCIMGFLCECLLLYYMIPYIE